MTVQYMSPYVIKLYSSRKRRKYECRVNVNVSVRAHGGGERDGVELELSEMAAHEHVDGEQEELAEACEYRLPREREQRVQLVEVAARKEAHRQSLPAVQRRDSHRRPLHAASGPIPCARQ